MTCREKFISETQGLVDKDMIPFTHCPYEYDIMEKPEWCEFREETCTRCWDREIPGTVPEKKVVKSTTKTKTELVKEINDLKKELEKVENYSKYEKAADETKAVLDSFVRAGFSEEQAFELLKIMFEKGLK